MARRRRAARQVLGLLLLPIAGQAAASSSAASASSSAVSASAASRAAASSASSASSAAAASASSSASSAASASAAAKWWWPFEGDGEEVSEDGGDLPAPAGAGDVADSIDGTSLRDEALPPVSVAQPRPRALRPSRAMSALSTQSSARGALVIPDDPGRGFGRTHRRHSGGGGDAQAGPVREYDLADPGQYAAEQDLAAARRQRQKRSSLAEVHSGASASGRELAPQEKMKEQCLRFATWAKKQDLQGPELVNMWKSTCQPAVMAGTATDRYRIMCEALGAAVAEFASTDWTPTVACTAVLRTFTESGVGATPLKG